MSKNQLHNKLKKSSHLTYEEEKVQKKLDELVEKYNEKRKSTSKGSQFYDNCEDIVKEIKYLKKFAKEFLDIEIEFWRKGGTQYTPGEIVDCKVISEKEIDEYELDI